MISRSNILRFRIIVMTKMASEYIFCNRTIHYSLKYAEIIITNFYASFAFNKV